MNALKIARALGGRRSGGQWMAPCPAHEDRTPSLAITESEAGRVLVHCHSGCSQAAVIEALQCLGLWAGAVNRSYARVTFRGPHARLRHSDDSAARRETALRLWDLSREGNGTLVNTYLESRGITLIPPSSLRFHGLIRHPEGGGWPAMLALVRRGVDGERLGIHRTYLARDGGGKAEVATAKMMLGPCRGGAVMLAEPQSEKPLMIGEGIETCLSAMQETGLPVWAALSTSGIRGLDLPVSVSEVIVLADGDDAGEEAARAAALRWLREGRRVRIARPPAGMDFNDLLAYRAGKLSGVAL